MACEENQTILLSSNTNKPLKSNVFPDLQVVEPRVLEYVVGAAANNLEDAANNPEDDNNSILVLKRRFEYEFGGFIPIQVMMLHLEEQTTTTTRKSPTSDKNQSISTETSTTLHLVEVYHCKNRFFRGIMSSFHLILDRLVRNRSDKGAITSTSGNHKNE